jgi:hypothetical protein
MRTRVILATVLVVLMALPLAVYAQDVDPKLKAEEFVVAANMGDAAAASAVVAEEAVVTVPVAMSESGGGEGEDPAAEQQAVGKAEIEAWIEGLTAVNAETTLGECTVEGEMATCGASFTSDALTAKGVDAIEGELMVKVNAEGMIEAYDFVASADSVAKLQAAGAAVAAPETMAVTGSASLPPNALAMVLGGLMVAGGLGMQALKRRGR